MNLFVLLGAAGLSHSLFGERLIPIATVYDPFVARGLDALNYACYQDARFMIVGTPSGVTLAPEGGAYQSCAANVELVKSLSADVVIDYKTKDFERVLSGYDLVLNSQDAKTLAKSLNVLKPGGKLISISGPPDIAFAKSLRLNLVLRLVMRMLSRGVLKKAKSRGVDYSFLFMRAEGQQLRKIAKLIGAGAIRQVVDKVLPLAQTPHAFAYVETGRAKGKVVVSGSR
jgi:NADPH:quinone reductase-like Zn-dependent oxidoreductase